MKKTQTVLAGELTAAKRQFISTEVVPVEEIA